MERIFRVAYEGFVLVLVEGKGSSGIATTAECSLNEASGSENIRRQDYTMASHAQPDSEGVEHALLTVEQLAVYLQVSRTTVFGLLSAGRFGPRPIRLGRCLRFVRSEIDRWLAAGAPPRSDWPSTDAAPPPRTRTQGSRNSPAP
jgi:excisionase family DNA binding protein